MAYGLTAPKCQALMAEHGYEDAKELQGHLLRCVEKKLRSLGKTYGGLGRGATWQQSQ